ncbi:MAG: MazG nucleotide pyrophosphohydrolase domain-containing protein [Gammaproteobacteria bacterium]
MRTLKRGVLDDVPDNLPVLAQAMKLQQLAARVGFDWDDMGPVLAKIREELAELEAEITHDAARERKQDELGDLLFSVANLARKLSLDPEQALRGTNRKFQRRFRAVEAQLAAQGKRPEDATLEEMDAIWEQSKHDQS